MIQKEYLSQLLKDRALIQSALTGFQNNVQVLLEANSNPHYDNNQALCMSSKYGHRKIVELLLESGADVHVEDDYPLMMASRHGHFAVVETLKTKRFHKIQFDQRHTASHALPVTHIE